VIILQASLLFIFLPDSMKDAKKREASQTGDL
jgi:hypothetical protein